MARGEQEEGCEKKEKNPFQTRKAKKGILQEGESGTFSLEAIIPKLAKGLWLSVGVNADL